MKKEKRHFIGPYICKFECTQAHSIVTTSVQIIRASLPCMAPFRTLRKLHTSHLQINKRPCYSPRFNDGFAEKRTAVISIRKQRSLDQFRNEATETQTNKNNARAPIVISAGRFFCGTKTGIRERYFPKYLPITNVTVSVQPS